MYKVFSPNYIGYSKRFLDIAETVSKAGFEGYWFDIVEDSKVPVKETLDLLAKTGLRSVGFSLPTDFRNDLETYETELSKLKEYARYAADIGAKRCVTWISPFSETYTYEENFNLHRERLTKINEILHENNILFGLEFIAPPKLRKGVKYEFIHNLDQMLALCEAIGTKNCGHLIDVWHWDLAGQTKEDFKKLTAESIALVHIMDAPAGIPFDEQETSIRKLPGETGVLKIAEFFDGLKSIGYDGPVLAEPFEKKLLEMTFEEAVSAVMASINKVWPF